MRQRAIPPATKTSTIAEVSAATPSRFLAARPTLWRQTRVQVGGGCLRGHSARAEVFHWKIAAQILCEVSDPGHPHRSRPVEKAARINRSGTFRGGPFLVRQNKKQITLIAAFGTEWSTLRADVHLVAALRAGKPVLRLMLHAALPSPI